MDSMTPHSKHILDRYRELESLDGDARLRVIQALTHRIANGESSVLGINVDPPTLPVAQSAYSLAAGSVAVKVGVAVVVAATSALLGWRVWVVQRAGERAPVALTAAMVVSSPRPAEQQPLATPKADRPTQPLSAQQPSAAAPNGAPKNPFPKLAAISKPRSQTRARQKVATSPSQRTATSTEIPEVTDRFDSVVSELTNGSHETKEGDTTAIEVKQNARELQTNAEAPRSYPDVSSPSRQSPPSSTLDEEMKLLRAAHAALRAGKPEQALAQLAEHSWRFPNGELAEPRDVAHIMALCRAGKVEASRSEAKRFLAQRPSSPFAGRVRAICVERPTPSR
jgi:hypothetical protein